VGFKFPDLWDPDFIAPLRLDSAERAKRRVDEVIAREQQKATEESRRSVDLRELKEQFFNLQCEPSPQAAGRLFEKILNRMFALNELAPREPFRVVGEQIDGSFDLDHETYLVEAKWEKTPVSEAPLLVFRGKVEGKSAFTRGVFISLNGVTDEARRAITQGKQPTFFVVDGYDLTMVLSDEVGLIEFLRQRRRLLAEEGRVVVPFPQVWPRSQRE
jgi:restriction endonuclease Mrr